MDFPRAVRLPLPNTHVSRPNRYLGPTVRNVGTSECAELICRVPVDVEFSRREGHILSRGCGKDIGRGTLYFRAALSVFNIGGHVDGILGVPLSYSSGISLYPNFLKLSPCLRDLFTCPF